jgi:hypothetical protein
LTTAGEPALNNDLWKAGMMAFNWLEARGVKASDAQVYRDWLVSAKTFLNETFFPDFVGLVQSGHIKLSGSTQEEFQNVWASYDWVQRLRLFLQVFEKTSVGLCNLETNLIGQYAALALLWRLDSAVISESLDGDGLIENTIDVIDLSHFLVEPELVKRRVEAAKKMARIETARAGGHARHAENKSMREDVFLWADSNMTNFKSMDKLVPVSFRTVRDWLGEWKKLRAASKPQP